MSQKYSITIAYPAGNTTALIEGFSRKNNYQKFAKEFLQGTFARKCGVEQVGFIEPATLPQADARLEMASGELCINATRSLAALLASKSILDSKELLFNLEVSGYGNSTPCPAVIPAFVTKISTNSYNISLNLDTDILLLNKKPIGREINFSGQKINMKQIALSGIDHLLVPLFALPKSIKGLLDQKNTGFSSIELPELKQVFELIYSDVPELAKSDAAGLVAYKKINDSNFIIYPLVMVNKQETIYYETACGSATVALAWLEFAKSDGKTTNLRVLQPSGSELSTILLKKGDSWALQVEGRVDIKDRITPK